MAHHAHEHAHHAHDMHTTPMNMHTTRGGRRKANGPPVTCDQPLLCTRGEGGFSSCILITRRPPSTLMRDCVK
jgi:hypothetical protein